MSASPYLMMESPNSQHWFKRCCSCISLRIGTLIMMYLALAYTTFVIVATSGTFIWLSIATNGFKRIETSSEKYPSPEIQRLFLAFYAAILGFLTLFHVFSLSLIIICLVGLHKRRPGLIHWHISFTVARILVMIAAVGYSFLLEVNYIIKFVQLVDIVLTAYHLKVLYVYTGRLKGEQKKEKEVNTAAIKTIYKENSNEKNVAGFKIPIA